MVSRSQRKLALRRKLRVLRSLTSSKSLRRKSVIMDALDYIKELKLKVEMLNNAYKNLVNQIQVPTEVKVERSEKGFVVRVLCSKGRDLLVRILEAFDQMGLNVLQARVSCNNSSFCMEAIGEEEEVERERLDVRVVKQALLKALESKVDGCVCLGPPN
ncbi:uncharacterized protein LOC131240970 [Magnolia sinica]|uniref:uncharacterized protein LOC131240970 n=1 Tax=Magnolia sinica TaxID=86752 RepID=UPI00265B468F|nr:uncharacterized protein LOC131240970 [Magnolia sinica]